MPEVVTTNDTRSISEELLEAVFGEFGLSISWSEADAVRKARSVIENRLDEVVRGWEAHLEEVVAEKDGELEDAKARIAELEA